MRLMAEGTAIARGRRLFSFVLQEQVPSLSTYHVCRQEVVFADSFIPP